MIHSGKKKCAKSMPKKMETADLDEITVLSTRNKEVSSDDENVLETKSERERIESSGTRVIGSRETDTNAISYKQKKESSEIDNKQTYVSSSELGELIRALTGKFEECNANRERNFVSIESFAKVVPNYDGVSIPIRQWIDNFNENAAAYELNEKQKYANARNKMVGTAKLYLEATTVANYESLCAALIEEFDQQLSSAELHKRLRSRKKIGDENFHEYVLQMRKIAALGEIEEESVITYIVDGLEVSDDVKFPLYSATTFKELRKRYELVEKLGKNNLTNKKRNPIHTNNNTRAQEETVRNIARKQQHYYNCGSTQHKRAESYGKQMRKFKIANQCCQE